MREKNIKIESNEVEYEITIRKLTGFEMLELFDKHKVDGKLKEVPFTKEMLNLAVVKTPIKMNELDSPSLTEVINEINDFTMLSKKKSIPSSQPSTADLGEATKK